MYKNKEMKMFKFFKEIKEAIQEGIAEANEELAEEKKQEEEHL